jgi:S-layer family protein
MRKLTFLVAAMTAFLLAGALIAQDSPKKVVKASPSPAKAVDGKMAPRTYGTTHQTYYRISAAEFTGMQVTGFDIWNDSWYSTPGNLFRRYGQNADAFFIAMPHLPSGALLDHLELDDCGGATDTVHADLYACDYTGDCGGAPVATINATAGCGADTVDLLSQNLVVDNNLNQFLVRVTTDVSDGSVSFAGVIFGYYLQVSPAPGVPSFNDVPVSDFGFQYIEALNASGITGGCGGGNYCPDNPVTRRQMAIFIAKALGLQWQ